MVRSHCTVLRGIQRDTFINTCSSSHKAQSTLFAAGNVTLKVEGKRPLGRPRRRWEDNIKIELQEVGGSGGDWMELAQDRDRWRAFVSTVKNLRVP
jgi:hypothetical protein